MEHCRAERATKLMHSNDALLDCTTAKSPAHLPSVAAAAKKERKKEIRPEAWVQETLPEVRGMGWGYRQAERKASLAGCCCRKQCHIHPHLPSATNTMASTSSALSAGAVQPSTSPGDSGLHLGIDREG